MLYENEGPASARQFHGTARQTMFNVRHITSRSPSFAPAGDLAPNQRASEPGTNL